MPDAEERLTNFETENVRAIVRREIPLSDWSVPRAQRKLYARPRLFEDMLSSQPLCFNLFGELACDLGLATKVFGVLTKRRGLRVTGVDFEWSPGRGDARFTHDGSAFDVFVRTETHGKRASTASR